MWWQKPITSLKGIGPKKAADFANLDILTVGDLLNKYPRPHSYLDYSQAKKIRELVADNSSQLFKAEVVNVQKRRSAQNRSYIVLTVGDGTGFAEVYLFFHQRFQANRLAPGDKVLVTGKVGIGRTAKRVSSALVQRLDEEKEQSAPGILPVYALSGNLTQNNIRTAVKQALALAQESLPESLPEALVRSKHLLPRLSALANIHFPQSFALLQQARRRFIFEELFLLQCGLIYYRQQVKDGRSGVKCSKDGALLTQVQRSLPFELTPAQQKAWQEISDDMQSITPMHRLLQGDVGSGKTVLALLALVKTVENGYQGCLMAPTEILAQQHYESLSSQLADTKIRVGLLTGSVKGAARAEILEGLATGSIDIVIGTHALIQEQVSFAKLALVITDEQHRFGVEQRSRLANKASLAPDVLVMTATPIPRTLALTVYGDLDVSIMKGLPPGRKPIQTLCYTEEKRPEVYAGMRRQLEAGYQAYVVCPLIEESENMEAKSVKEIFEELTSSYLQGVPCGLLHGKMKPSEKEAVMQAFASGTLKVLIATTVIEVGVNVPNAVLMVIEGADRFGLAQMHQLRGRVGRSSIQSYCVLLSASRQEETLERLQIMRQSHDGFYLAEKDLELRGAGQLFGNRQHGLPDLYIADILRDIEVLLEARESAQRIMSEPEQAQALMTLVRNQLDERFTRIFDA